jgi:hypothetical protein
MAEERAFQIKPAKDAMATYVSLDASLQAELREHCAKIGDDPAGMMARVSHPFGLDEMYVAHYRSDVVPEMQVDLYMIDLDLRAWKATLVAIVCRYHD